jgi:hypothetical protein
MPALLELCEQSSRTTHRIRVAGHALSAAGPALGHQPRALQHGHVFLHRGERHVVMRCELAHGRVGVHYPRQNVAPCGIRERTEQLVQNVRRRLFTYNHLVVDSSTPLAAQPIGFRPLSRHAPAAIAALVPLPRTHCSWFSTNAA